MSSAIDIFARGARDGVYPGGQLAISREGQRLVTVSVGVLGPGLGPTNDDIHYDLASLTKPLATATLVGRALERGLLELTHPLSRFVPGVDPRVTVGHVLDHSAGFPAHRRFDGLLPPTLEPGTWDAWRAIVREAAATPLERSPGEEATYSDVGYILLGAALEIVYGMPLSTAQVLSGVPLMFRDRRGLPALPPFPLRHGAAPTEGGKTGVVHDENAEAMGGAAGHAGLFGTAEGVIKTAEQWLYAYHGRRGGLLEPDTVRRFWQGSGVRDSTRTLGWDRPSREGSSTGGQWPPTAVGHLGFTGTSVWIEPERALVAVLVTNRVCPSRANNLIRRLRPALHDAIWSEHAGPRPRPRTPPPSTIGAAVPSTAFIEAAASAARASPPPADLGEPSRSRSKTSHVPAEREPARDPLGAASLRGERTTAPEAKPTPRPTPPPLPRSTARVSTPPPPRSDTLPLGAGRAPLPRLDTDQPTRRISTPPPAPSMSPAHVHPAAEGLAEGAPPAPPAPPRRDRSDEEETVDGAGP